MKDGLHPRNRFRGRYDFPRLIACCPALAAFIARNEHGDDSVDFANPEAVKTLNRALLIHAYGLGNWDIPSGYLCPPIPGRSDYLHHLADLLAAGDAEIPRGKSVAVLDVGVGANCIYPLIGASEYGWRFVGSEIDPAALRWARNLAATNPAIAHLIECRPQTSAMECFKGVIHPGEFLDLTMCNPPFHASAAEAAAGTRRKVRNLSGRQRSVPVLNFGGKSGELWCSGGELAFIQRMIAQSAALGHRCLWFTTLVSKSVNLPRLHAALNHARAADVQTIEMAHGQKKSRILAWTFCTPAERRAWRRR